MGKLFVVRHADAGDRSGWNGSDSERPLSAKGERQAKGLVEALADRSVGRLLSSPHTRCRQTLQPLSEHLGLEVESDDRLIEGAGPKKVLALAREAVESRAVLCSHGDVIPDLLEALLADGVSLRDELRWQKASTWVMSHDGERFTKARYLPPPR